MITLYQTKPLFGLPNSSPFCMKLEAFLRWQSIDFEIQNGLPFQGPHKKIPFVDYKNERLGDSTEIINRLISDNSISYSEHLEVEIGLAFQRMVEEHLYWFIVYFRWMDSNTWPKVKAAFFDSVPVVIRPFVVKSAWKQAKQALHGQGIGRLTEEMILNRVKTDLTAINQRLSNNLFVSGDQMTHFDLSVWAVLSQIVSCDLLLKITPVAQQFEHLMPYLERVNKELQLSKSDEFEMKVTDAVA